MSKTLYLVGQFDWQYNDENYYRNGDGCNPVALYEDEAKADEACLKKNIAERKKVLSDDYLLVGYLGGDYAIRKFEGSADALEVLNAHGISSEDLRDYWEIGYTINEKFNQMTPEEQQVVAEGFNLNFYKVFEVGVEN